MDVSVSTNGSGALRAELTVWFFVFFLVNLEE